MKAAAFQGAVLRGEDWRGQDFTGRRVAVIASGTEAVKVVPHIARTATSVKVFLHSPAWVLPRPGGPVGTLMSAGTQLPVVGRPARRLLARAHLRRSVRDAWTRRGLTPHAFDAAHTLASRTFYQALQRDTCTLVTWPVYAIVPHGVRTAEGIEHHVDCIVAGDGFDVAATTTREDRIA